ncbi:hypothetical protein BLNAU_2860 [Blattamonas nauphoetae]|uniref:Uncharacterized protein n=1 Tax=Blattamonas nauphoetae TaxID=2049346 RepID=A0ABQ9YEL1_9EUKA|nr:hypothetical protein BLNAU_2860 [Blattamonas nauphoetae]
MSEPQMYAVINPVPPITDPNKKFDSSIFAETDDDKVVLSLRQCLMVLDPNKSSDYITDLPDFLNHLLLALHSHHTLVRVLSQFIYVHLTASRAPLFPKDKHFRSLQSAFRDGSIEEQMTLLLLWTRWWIEHSKGELNDPKMEWSDFDFEGFLAADLTETRLFDEAVRFVIVLFLFPLWDEQSFERYLFFFLQFDQTHDAQNRLLSPPRSNASLPSRMTGKIDHVMYSTILSLFHGVVFPPLLTTLICLDIFPSSDRSSKGFTPFFYLNHTSIDHTHRHSFMPMDLFFERQLRFSTRAFFPVTNHSRFCRQRRFLFTPLIGFHSLLFRSIRLSLTDRDIIHMVMLFSHIIKQDSTMSEIFNLFAAYPPPFMVQTFVPSPLSIKDDLVKWSQTLMFCWRFLPITAPFGDCSSLATIFKMFAPLDPSSTEENTLVRGLRHILVNVHYLNIPPHFDSPLIAHLPTVFSSQPSILPCISEEHGIRFLLEPFTPLDPLDQDNEFDDAVDIQHAAYVRVACSHYVPFSAPPDPSDSVMYSLVLEGVHF